MSEEKVKLIPAKRFFVEMLTRDIELVDAILDLIDNCLDGAMRASSGEAEKPYQGFKVDISFDDEHFCVTDNCGGIPRDLARESAFRMGRHDNSRDSELPTVGVYGIGMKRAIFKIGEDAIVKSSTKEDNFSVEITPEWMRDDNDWELPIAEDNSPLETTGTQIHISSLRGPIKNQFKSKSFNESLLKIVSTHYSYIIEKGFAVNINGMEIKPSITITRFSKGFTKERQTIAPYVYKSDIDGVSVEVVIGFYRGLGTFDEEESEKQGKSLSENAGITIICNDRVVLHNDKSHITGWGEANVPSYHTQFIAISGVVIFHSNSPSKLPLKTTKRGVDSSSQIYAQVKEKMREGLKIFTDFTNKWKKSGKEVSEYFKTTETEAAPSISVAKKVKDTDWSTARRGGGQVFKPNLPMPKDKDPSARVVFTKKKSEIETVSLFLFDEHRQASEVGEYCFDKVLEKASDV